LAGEPGELLEDAAAVCRCHGAPYAVGVAALEGEESAGGGGVAAAADGEGGAVAVGEGGGVGAVPGVGVAGGGAAGVAGGDGVEQVVFVDVAEGVGEHPQE
jgi:hypothetical protein